MMGAMRDAGQPGLPITTASGGLSLGRGPVPRQTMPTRRGPRQSSASDAAPDTRADDLANRAVDDPWDPTNEQYTIEYWY